jgi:hypothetical protein
LIERFGAIVAGVAAIVMDENETTRELDERYPILTLSQDLYAGSQQAVKPLALALTKSTPLNGYPQSMKGQRWMKTM